MTFTTVGTPSLAGADDTNVPNTTNLVPASTSTPLVKANAIQGSQFGNTGPFPCAVWTGTTCTTDHYFEVTIGGLSSLGDGYRVGGILRAATATNASRTYYQVTLDYDSPTASLRISKQNGATFTELTSATTTWANGDKLLGAIVGTTINVYKNRGSSLLSTTDSTFSTGQPGCLVGCGYGSGLNEITAFEVGSATAGGGPVTVAASGSASTSGSGTAAPGTSIGL